MIGYLRGRHVAVFANGAVVVDVQGVGYEVHVASSDFLTDDIELFIHTAVRDDAIVLFGFETLDDRAFFELLLTVPGVGPSTAIAALRALGRAELTSAILAEDAKRVAKAPGIGAKTAQRMVLELKDKVVAVEGEPPIRRPINSDSITEALKSLGYAATEIRDALANVELPDDEAQAIRIALGMLART